MVLPIENEAIFIRGFTGKSSQGMHPGLDVIPSDTGYWEGLEQQNPVEYKRRTDKRLNTNIVACVDGFISYVGNIAGGGLTIVLDCPQPTCLYRFIYCHLSTIEVSIGTVINAGTVLGKMGNSGMYVDGRQDNIHLHLTTHINPENDDFFNSDTLIDPMTFFEIYWGNKDRANMIKVKEVFINV